MFRQVVTSQTSAKEISVSDLQWTDIHCIITYC